MDAFQCPSTPITANETGFSTCANLLDPESLTFIGEDSVTGQSVVSPNTICTHHFRPLDMPTTYGDKIGSFHQT